MPYQLGTARAPNGVAAVVVQGMPEPVEALPLMRMLKAAFPAEWREVNYEILTGQAANGAVPRFELPVDDRAGGGVVEEGS